MSAASGLYVALDNALSGLSVSKQALATLSQNISNANTPGYSRQQVMLADNIVNGQGYGAKISDITREVNQYLQLASQQQNSVYSKANVLNTYAGSIQALLGQPDNSQTGTNDTSIASAITGFFNAVQQLSQSPSDSSMQLAAVQSGANAASQISGLATGLENLQYQADQQISQDVTTVNNTLKELQSTNAAIVSASASGQSTPDLLDQRDSLVNTLSQYLDISYYTDSSQQVHVSTNGGVPLLDGTSLYQLNYTPQSSAQNFAANIPMQPITVSALNSSGQAVGTPVTLVSGGGSANVSTGMVNGEIRGLLDIRDTQIPQMLSQLDTLAATLRDQVNAINNSGSAYPGANSYTGQRAVNGNDTSAWTGNVQIALLDQNGQPVASPYANSPSGLPPLNLDLGTLNTGSGNGTLSTQGIVDAINRYYAPQNQASLGDINNIQLASDSSSLPGSPAQLNFDFNLQNLSANNANFFVTGVTVQDDTGTTIASNASTTAPVIDLASSNTYTTTAGSNMVTIATAGTLTGLNNGDYVYLSQPPADVNGIPAGQLGGFFKVSNVTANGFQVEVPDDASTGGSVSDSGMTATPKYTTINAGDNSRTNADGTFTVNLSGNTTSDYYTVSVDVATQNADGTISSGQVRYQVLNPATNILNAAYGAAAVSGNAVLTPPSSTAPLLTATLVDSSGKELPKVNGQYITTENGYLKLTAVNANDVVAINSENSQQLGLPNDVPPQAGTNQGFSSYFGLNNFFNSNNLTPTGDTVAGSAANLSVEQRLLTNPSLISTGQLVQSPANNGTPLYTYERDPGDNSVIQKMVGLGTTNLFFAASGGLGNTNTSLNGYAGEILSFASASAASAQNNFTNEQTVTNSLAQQVSTVSGVNLDQELANTVIFQNAYTASARIITITSSLFTALLNAFGG